MILADMRKIIFFIALLILIIAPIRLFNTGAKGMVRAFGPLTVNYSATPLFNESSWMPASGKTGNFTVQNTDPFSQTVLIKAGNVNNTGSPSLSEVLNIVIKRNGIVVYGEGSATGKKHLSNFYTESAVSLGTAVPLDIIPVSITLTMDSTAGGEYQGKNTVFDLFVGADSEISRMPILPTLPKLKPLPTLRPLPTLKPLPTFPAMRFQFPFR